VGAGASPSLGPKGPHESLGHKQKRTFLLKNMHWIKFDFPSRPTLKIKASDAPSWKEGGGKRGLGQICIFE
jgi:hypothetical protein